MSAAETSEAENSVEAPRTTEPGGIRVLYLYSGPHRPIDGLAKFLHELGAECVCVDKELDNDHDLLDQHFWEKCSGNFDEFDSFLVSPPCSTFTPARRGNGGPQPLRGVEGAEVYGLNGLKPNEKKQVAEGNVLAIRAENTATYAHVNGRWWIIEQPHRRSGKTSMWNLDEFKRLREMEGVYLYTFDQCRFGCLAEKRTDLLSNIPGLDEFTVLCNHESQRWVIPWSGEVVVAPHPPLRGKQWAVLESEWSPTMLRKAEPPGDYITRSCAAYPAELNAALAKALLRRRRPTATVAQQTVPPVIKATDTVKVQKLIPLRGAEKMKTADDSSNSLRDVHKWVTDKARFIGIQVRNIVFQLFDQQPEVEADILESLGKRSNEDIINTSWMQGLRNRVLDLLSRNRAPGMEPTCNVDEVDEDGYRTCIRGRLLEYWARVVSDPGKECAKWTYKGAPAGLEVETKDLDGVFPQVLAEEDETPWESMTTEFDNFQNYVGVEEDDEAYETLEGYRQKGFLDRFDTLQELTAQVGGRPTLSKLGCIKKTKVNLETGETITKSRIILDCKRSYVSKVAKRTHKAILPRVTDAVQSLLKTMAKSNAAVSMLIADITDAFWLIPLRKEERYFTAKLRGKYYSFNRTAQGSRGAPLTFAAIIAIAARWVASADHDMQLQVYVDDPIAVLQGTETVRKRVACLVIVMWSLMGFPIATHKATLDSSLVWIGVQMQVEPTQVRVEVPAAKVVELEELLAASVTGNLVSKKSLRTLIGKAMAIASVLFVWRPFIAELYTRHFMQSRRMRHRAASGQGRLNTQCDGCGCFCLANWLVL